jgi:hypothetical protein
MLTVIVTPVDPELTLARHRAPGRFVFAVSITDVAETPLTVILVGCEILGLFAVQATTTTLFDAGVPMLQLVKL